MHCPAGSGGVVHCTARGGKALQWSLGLKCTQETGPAKFNGEQGEIGNGDTAPGGLSFLSTSNYDNMHRFSTIVDD